MKGFIKKIEQINFGLMSPEDIRAMSVVTVETPDTYEDDGFPIDKGLMDPRLGVIDPSLVCRTCGFRGGDCQGHFGSIELARPVIHIGFGDVIHKILRSTCNECGRVLLNDDQIEYFTEKINEAMDNRESLNAILKEVYRVLKKDCEFWFHLSESLPEIKGAQLCTVTDGVETFSLKDLFYFLRIPEIRYRMVSHKREGFIVVSPSATILRKGNRELSLPVMEEYTTTDLSLEFPEKAGYLASHYTIQSNIKFHKMKKVLIIAASPHGYGHLYRGEIISKYLSRNGFEVTYLSNNDVPLTHSSEEQFSTYLINMSQGLEGQNARRLFLEHIGEKNYDIVLIDHFPLGKLFFLDSFKVLHKKLHLHSKFICVFRDIFSIDDFRQRSESISVLNTRKSCLCLLS